MEKVTEWCPYCETEVELDAIPCVLQECPHCHRQIRACCLCNPDSCDCAKCEKGDK